MQENRVQDSTTVAIVLYLLLETDLKNEKKKKKKIRKLVFERKIQKQQQNT